MKIGTRDGPRSGLGAAVHPRRPREASKAAIREANSQPLGYNTVVHFQPEFQLSAFAALLVLSSVVATGQTVVIDGRGGGRAFDGVGAISGGGGNSRLLIDYAEPGHCGGAFGEDLSMRSMVEMLIVAFASSNKVPPMEPVMILLANHRSVLTSNTDRNGTPLIVKIAKVAMHEPITGNQPARFLAKSTPMPTFAAIITVPSANDRYRSARNDRNDEMSELAEAGRFPSKTKCRAYTKPCVALKSLRRSSLL